MTTEDLTRKADGLLRRWRQRLVAGHALPLFLVGLGQDHNAGKSTVCLPEEVSLAAVRPLVQQLLDLIDAELARMN